MTPNNSNICVGSKNGTYTDVAVTKKMRTSEEKEGQATTLREKKLRACLNALSHCRFTI
jgi:hypothetical protein